MPPRPLIRVPVPPGPAGVEHLTAALRPALAGTGPAICPVPVTSVTVPAAYVARLLAACRPDDPGAPLEDEQAAVVLATSGSTGDPRGVLLTAAGLLATAAGLAGLPGPAGRPGTWLAALPVTSAGGLQTVLRSLRAGTEPEALPSVGGAAPFTPAGFAAGAGRLAARASDGPRFTALVPAQLARLLGDPAATEALRDFAAVLVGGAALPSSVAEAAATAGVRLVRTYGMTETGGGCVLDGRPMTGARVRIDPPVAAAGSDGSPAAAANGGPGEIVIGGDVVALGYRLRPEATAAAFTAGWYRTGDLGRLDAAGRLDVLGRRDDIVQVRGMSVSLSAVERLLGADPAVRAVAVVAGSDDADGARVVAFAIARDPDAGAGLAARLRAGVRASLGPAAVPRRVDWLTRLPTLPNGKTDRAALRARA